MGKVDEEKFVEHVAQEKRRERFKAELQRRLRAPREPAQHIYENFKPLMRRWK